MIVPYGSQRLTYISSFETRKCSVWWEPWHATVEETEIGRVRNGQMTSQSSIWGPVGSLCFKTREWVHFWGIYWGSPSVVLTSFPLLIGNVSRCVCLQEPQPSVKAVSLVCSVFEGNLEYPIKKKPKTKQKTRPAYGEKARMTCCKSTGQLRMACI